MLGHEMSPPAGRWLRARWPLLAVLLAALAARVASALLWAPPATGDAADYLRLAEGLISGAGFVGPDGLPTSWRPPLYPAWIATVLATEAWWGPTAALAAVRVLQALLSACTVLWTHWIASEVGGPRVGLWAGALQAMNVAHIAAVSRVLSETLFTTLVVASVACLVAGTRPGATDRNGRSLVPFAAAGALLGLAALTRSAALLLPGVLVPTLLLAARPLGVSRKVAILGAAALCAAFLLVLAPWTARNLHVHGAFVPVATQGGATLYAGNHPADGRVLGVMADDERARRAEAMTEVDASAYLVRGTLTDWTKDPREALRLVVLKILYLLTPEDWELLPGSGRFNASYAFTALLLLSLPVCLLPRSEVLRERREGRKQRPSSGDGPEAQPRRGWGGEPESAGWRLWPAWAFGATWLVVAVVFYGSPRLRFPVEPMLSIGAAFAMAGWVRKKGMRTAGTVAAAVAGATVVALVFWDPVGTVIKSALVAVGVW